MYTGLEADAPPMVRALSAARIRNYRKDEHFVVEVCCPQRGVKRPLDNLTYSPPDRLFLTKHKRTVVG